jgi:hypothetical protein
VEEDDELPGWLIALGWKVGRTWPAIELLMLTKLGSSW